MRVVFGLTVIGGAGLLGLAVWPGLLGVVLFGIPLVFVSLLLLGFWFLLLIVLGIRDIVNPPTPNMRFRRWGLASALVMFGTLGLLWFHVPQRVAFAFCSADLQRLTDTAQTSEWGGEEIDSKVGLYRVDQYAADPRGGVFFRTATGPDGLGPDQMSYGFAFRPNGVGTPFGKAHYYQHHLFDDWYMFAVSDDW
ncbi:hypothetical protein [Gemmata sp.]|uniref:hypothetical protein n=1 Tax=Gemmata sp. TaxID=1914242 RepID=UPI003F70D66B